MDDIPIILPISAEYGKKIVSNFHQGAFGSNQCVAMAFTSIAVSWMTNSTAAKWTSDDLNFVLHTGDYNYQQIVGNNNNNKAPMLTTDSIDSLMMFDSNTRNLIGIVKVYKIYAESSSQKVKELFKSFERKVDKEDHDRLTITINMYLAIKNLIENRKVMGIVIVYNSYSFSIIKSLNGLYFFDSHANFNIQTNKFGAMLLQVVNAVDVVRVLLLKVGIPGNGVDVTGLQFVFQDQLHHQEWIKKNLSLSIEHRPILSSKYHIIDVLLQYLYNTDLLHSNIIDNFSLSIDDHIHWGPYKTNHSDDVIIVASDDEVKEKKSTNSVSDIQKEEKTLSRKSISKSKKKSKRYRYFNHNSEVELRLAIEKIKNMFFQKKTNSKEERDAITSDFIKYMLNNYNESGRYMIITHPNLCIFNIKKVYAELFPDYVVISWWTTDIQIHEIPVPYIFPLRSFIKSEHIKKIVTTNNMKDDCIVDNYEDKFKLQNSDSFFHNINISVVSVNDCPLFIPKKNVKNFDIINEHPWVVVTLVDKGIDDIKNYWFTEDVTYDGQELMLPPKDFQVQKSKNIIKKNTHLTIQSNSSPLRVPNSPVKSEKQILKKSNIPKEKENKEDEIIEESNISIENENKQDEINKKSNVSEPKNSNLLSMPILDTSIENDKSIVIDDNQSTINNIELLRHENNLINNDIVKEIEIDNELSENLVNNIPKTTETELNIDKTFDNKSSENLVNDNTPVELLTLNTDKITEHENETFPKLPMLNFGDSLLIDTVNDDEDSRFDIDNISLDYDKLQELNNSEFEEELKKLEENGDGFFSNDNHDVFFPNDNELQEELNNFNDDQIFDEHFRVNNSNDIADNLIEDLDVISTVIKQTDDGIESTESSSTPTIIDQNIDSLIETTADPHVIESTENSSTPTIIDQNTDSLIETTTDQQSISTSNEESAIQISDKLSTNQSSVQIKESENNEKTKVEQLYDDSSNKLIKEDILKIAAKEIFSETEMMENIETPYPLISSSFVDNMSSFNIDAVVDEDEIQNKIIPNSNKNKRLINKKSVSVNKNKKLVSKKPVSQQTLNLLRKKVLEKSKQEFDTGKIKLNRFQTKKIRLPVKNPKNIEMLSPIRSNIPRERVSPIENQKEISNITEQNVLSTEKKTIPLIDPDNELKEENILPIYGDNIKERETISLIHDKSFNSPIKEETILPIDKDNEQFNFSIKDKEKDENNDDNYDRNKINHLIESRPIASLTTIDLSDDETDQNDDSRSLPSLSEKNVSPSLQKANVNISPQVHIKNEISKDHMVESVIDQSEIKGKDSTKNDNLSSSQKKNSSFLEENEISQQDNQQFQKGEFVDNLSAIKEKTYYNSDYNNLDWQDVTSSSSSESDVKLTSDKPLFNILPSKKSKKKRKKNKSNNSIMSIKSPIMKYLQPQIQLNEDQSAIKDKSSKSSDVKVSMTNKILETKSDSKNESDLRKFPKNSKSTRDLKSDLTKFRENLLKSNMLESDGECVKNIGEYNTSISIDNNKNDSFSTILKNCSINPLTMETTPLVQGVMCATKSKEDSDLEFQLKSVDLMEKLGKLERDNKISLVDKQIELKKLDQDNHFKRMEYQLKLQQLKTNASLKLKQLTYNQQSKNFNKTFDLLNDPDKLELNELLENTTDIKEKQEIMKLIDANKKSYLQDQQHQLEVLKVMLTENRAQLKYNEEKSRFENNNSKKLIFMFSDESNGTQFYTSNQNCSAIAKASFLEIWNYQTPLNISDNNYLEKDTKLELIRLSQLCKEVVENDVQCIDYIKQLTVKQGEYGQSVLNMRIKMCQVMSRSQMFLFQTGSRYCYPFYIVNKQYLNPNQLKLNKSPLVTRYAMQVNEQIYIADTWEFFYTRNMFPACMLYTHVPEQVQLLIMNKERYTAILKRPLAFKKSEKANFCGKFLTSQYQIAASPLSTWFEFISASVDYISDDNADTISSPSNETKNLDSKKSITNIVIDENVFPSAERLSVIGDTNQVMTFLITKLNGMLPNIHMSKKIYKPHWIHNYLNFIWFLHESLKYVFWRNPDKVILKKFGNNIKSIIKNEHKITEIESKAFFSSLLLQDLAIGNMYKEIINYLLIK